jgi:hypothetical protein
VSGQASFNAKHDAQFPTKPMHAGDAVLPNDAEPLTRDFTTLQAAVSHFSDTQEALGAIYRGFEAAVRADEGLLRHRVHIESNKLGFGDLAFHWLWKLIVDFMPSPFRFLEVGVYKGQVVSLINFISQRIQKESHVFGVTPLGAFGDKFSKYAEIDYRAAITDLEEWCGIPSTRRTRIIEGFSTDSGVKRLCRELAPFDLIYIDGGHDYHVVAQDIISYGELVKLGGLLAMDDSSTELQLPEGIFPGHTDVGRAVRELLVTNPHFTELIAVGHVRVWQRTMA